MGFGYGDKGVLINLMDDIQKLRILTDTERNHDHVLFIAGIATGHMENSGAAVQLANDFLTDGLPLLGNDLGQECLGASEEKIVYYQGAYECGRNTQKRNDQVVDDEDTEQNNNSIDDEDNHRAFEPFEQLADQECQNIRATGRTAAEKGDGASCSQKDSSENGGQQDGNVPISGSFQKEKSV